MVLAIVSMLVALLLPALARARGAAQDIKCAAQLKQIFTGVIAYAMDDKNRLPNHLGNTSTGTRYQWRKNPKITWGQTSNTSEATGRVYIGAGKILQHHMTNFNILYCPSSEMAGGGSFNLTSVRTHTDSTVKGFGHWRSPVGTQAGGYNTNYVFPAVDVDYTTRTNSGGEWVSEVSPYWSTTGTFNSYANWKDSMLKPRLDDNLPAAPMLWDDQSVNNFAHKLRSTSVIYVDGGFVSYGATRMVQENSPASNGVVGLSGVNGATWLRRYRTEGFLPY